MISLQALSEPADWIAASALGLLALIMFFGRANRVARLLARGRYEFGLIWGLAAILRMSLAVHSPLATAMLQVATATVMGLTAAMALVRVLRRG